MRALGVVDAVPAESFHLFKVSSVFFAGEGIGRIRTELGAVAKHKGGDVPPSRREGEGTGDGKGEVRGEAPFAGIRPLRVRKILQRRI